VSDPLIATIGAGLALSALASAAWRRYIGRQAEDVRRSLEWRAVIAALGLSCAALVAADREGAIGWAGALIVGAPPFVIFVIARSATASVLVTLVPVYIFIATGIRERTERFSPATFVDALVPLDPRWMLFYGSIWAFVLLPLFVAPRAVLLRAARADIALLLIAYASFLALPTQAPRPSRLVIDGFATWTLRVQYDVDPPFNCFPSLHVAHSYVSAFTAARVHRGVGAVAIGWATLIALSTLFTKQHYAADVLVGAALAVVAWPIFTRGLKDDAVTPADRAAAPARGLAVAAIYGALVCGSYAAYALGF
jgi:membrane-associated phospholipid phosphatase